jgi:HK97 family phage prohead protease
MPSRYFQVKKFNVPMELNEGCKAIAIKGVDGAVIDYRDVETEGFLSTFVTKTSADRIGDYVLPGAFTETISPLSAFMKNPISLVDHVNSVFMAAGAFKVIEERKDGLWGVVKITNAPNMADLRVRVVERVIRAMSMSGFFYYLEDGNGIYKVDLFEGSFVAIPMNPDALFNVRNLDLDDYKALAKQARTENAVDELRLSTIAGRIVAPENVSKALELLGGAKQFQEEEKYRGLSVGGIKISKGEQRK